MKAVERRRFTDRFPPGNWFTLVLTALVLMMLWASFDLSDTSAWIPRLVLIVTLACLLLQLAVDLRAARNVVPETRNPAEQGLRRRTLAAFAWLALLLLLTWLFGVAPASAVFCLGWLRWHAGENWKVSLVISVGLGLVLWVLFTVFLGADHYPGALTMLAALWC